jgi:Na+/pantothenate symporter
MKLAVEPRQLSRFYALENARAVRIGAWVSTLTIAVVYAALAPIGLYARRIVPEGITQTDAVVPTLLTMGTVFSPAAASFLLVGMIAAAMSSLDSVLLVTASTADRDIVRILRGPSSDRDAVRATRGFVALFAAIAALIALNPPGGIVALTSFSGALYAACFAPALLLGLYWRRGGGLAVLASFATGIVVLLVWKRLPVAASLHEVFPALFLSFAVYTVVALLTPPAGAEAVDALFARASPGAGADRADSPLSLSHPPSTAHFTGAQSHEPLTAPADRADETR